MRRAPRACVSASPRGPNPTAASTPIPIRTDREPEPRRHCIARATRFSRFRPQNFAYTFCPGTACPTSPCALPCTGVQASDLLSQGSMVSFINLGPYSFVRVELLPLTPNGPYRLTVEHPAKTLVEYFETPIAAMSRQAEIERVLTNHGDAVTVTTR